VRSPDSTWYEEAVIYCIDVEKFADGNGDGIGDFIGLTGKLTYLSELGITCIWLLPFYRSPDRDNGYDVSDFYSVNPKVGTLDDFLTFLHSAGEHGIRVVIDLVVNHTSDQHPWFQAARRDDETRYRDYYVWTADPPPVAAGAKSIFPGEVDSLWTYDEIARAYYFHHFYDFQPELNAANPQVREEILRVVDYWIAFGVSGFRLDAAPLIIADKGLEHANPRDPHGILREIGDYLQGRRPGGVLLGEVNLPPEASGAFFGEGDQLQLLLNFMLACYLFAGFAKEEAAVINQGLSLLPEPPPGCGWVNFLRNLDELDFSRVPPDLKEAVFEAFAPKKEMELFGRGIRRRVAPMLSGDQRRIELAFSIVSADGPQLAAEQDQTVYHPAPKSADFYKGTTCEAERGRPRRPGAWFRRRGRPAAACSQSGRPADRDRDQFRRNAAQTLSRSDGRGRIRDYVDSSYGTRTLCLSLADFGG
jgi:maltose alpha-D-glucosyltransferase/alpha-amylase